MSVAQPTITDLPTFSLSRAKNLLTPEKWTSLSSSLVHRLDQLLHVSQDELAKSQKELILFLQSYFSDSAKGCLEQSDGTQLLSKPEEAVRSRALRVADRLSEAGIMLDEALLLDLAIVYQRSQETVTVRNILEHRPSAASGVIRDRLLPAYLTLLRTPFNTAAQDDAQKYTSARLKLVRSIKALLRSEAPSILSTCLGSKDFILALAFCYKTALDSVAWDRGGVRIHEQGLSANWQIPWMETKVGILDIFHLIMEYAVKTSFDTRGSMSSSEALMDVMMSLIEDATSKAGDPKAVWFVDPPMLADYEHAYRLSQKLRSEAKGADEMADYVAGALEGLTSGSVEGDAGGLVILLRQLPHVTTPAPPSTNKTDKGKARAENQNQHSDSDLDAAVAQVLDILPEEDPSFLRVAIQDPSMAGSAENLIAALLEGNLSPNLAALKAGNHAPSTPLPAIERRNVFDDDEMDFSKLTIGKSRATDDVIVQDQDYMAQMKADILRRAQEMSQEEDDEDTGRHHNVAFEEELEDAVDGRPAFKLAGVDGEDTDDDDDEAAATAVKSQPPTAQKSNAEDILAVAYLKDAKAFDRDGNTRRSKARADLRAATGWGDEQIEGWRIMLDRNPRKDKILEKYGGSSERPQNRLQDSAPNSGSSTPNTGGRGAESGSRGGSGGRGGQGSRGGRGRGDGGEKSKEQIARDRAYKEKSGSRMRQRGNDKKVARGGAP